MNELSVAVYLLRAHWIDSSSHNCRPSFCGPCDQLGGYMVHKSNRRMRFTLMGHAALYLESDQVSLLVDPWLFGSCYWRSWWHYPPLQEVPGHWLHPDYLYLTHHHFDHFHYPSLRRIDKRTKVLVPEFGVDFMAGELRRVGFSDITELPHAKTLELPGGVSLASFQYGFDDSALLVSEGPTVIANFNDCKIRGRALQQVLDTFGRPTFLLKNYSWAQAYPICYRAEDPAELSLLRRENYAQDFLATVRHVRPDYAVPIASMVCFLHPETVHLNETVITPGELEIAFLEAKLDHTRFVTMGPGDSWGPAGGFQLSGTDYYSDRSQRLARLRQAVAPQVAQSQREEADRRLHFETFHDYFRAFLRALRPGIHVLLSRPVAFQTSDEARPYWVLDFRHRTVTRAATVPSNGASVIDIPEGVLADAIEKRIVNFVHISMRLKVTLRPGGVHVDLPFWGLLTIWELGYLPLRRLATRRAVTAAWRRRSEIWESFCNLVGRGSLVSRMSSNMMTGSDGARTAGGNGG